MNNDVKNYLTILDLPIKKQEKLAKEQNLSLEEWKTQIQRVIDESNQHSNNFQWGVRPDDYSEIDAKQFQNRISSLFEDK